VSDDLSQIVYQKICKSQHFIISELSCEFPKISGTVLYKIITVRLGNHKFSARLISKILKGVHKTVNNSSTDFFRTIP
jgi:hypothetical protein